MLRIQDVLLVGDMVVVLSGVWLVLVLVLGSNKFDTDNSS